VQENVKIKIDGFNGSKTYLTSIVEIPIQLNGMKKFRAAIVPEIRAKVDASNLKDVISKCSQLGIPLADENLLQQPTVDVLLGVDYAHILPVHSCTFGLSDKPSMIYYCAAGVMLTGSVTSLVGNIPHLHLVKKFIDKFDSFS
jgi:hypothetical protein